MSQTGTSIPSITSVTGRQQTPVEERRNGGEGDGHNPPPPGPAQGGAQTAPPPEPAATPSDAPQEAKKGSPLKRAVIVAVVLTIVVIGGAWGFRAWSFGRTHVSTDDAYVSGDLINVSPTISGRLAVLLVDEGDQVKKGQLIARLTDNTQLAAIQQAQAALQAAQSQIPQAASGLAFQQLSTESAILRAEAGVAAQRARTLGAQREVGLTSATVANQVAQARSQVAAAQAQAEQFDAQTAAARTAVANARLGVETAERASRAVTARIDAARAEEERTRKDEERYRSLVDQQAISQQQFEAVHAAAVAARSRLTAAQEEANQSRAQVDQAREAVVQAEAQLRAAQKAAAASHQEVTVAQSGVALARSRSGQIGVQQAQAQGQEQEQGQAQADVAAAAAGREQVELKRKQVETARAQAAQASATLETARIAETHTYIYAPADGIIVKKEVNPGAALSAGQSIVTMTQGERVWITANFKETQLTNVRTGQPAEVEIDTFPGRTFRGRVQSINETTGAATALLPPDNATGNFTKVVQRVPVRVELIPAGAGRSKADPYGMTAGAEDIRSLRQGMSAVVTIATIDTGRGR